MISAIRLLQRPSPAGLVFKSLFFPVLLQASLLALTITACRVLEGKVAVESAAIPLYVLVALLLLRFFGMG